MGGDYGYAFRQAAKYTKGREGPVLWIVLHATDDHEDPNYAENLGNYFANGSGGRNVSSHFGTDSDSVMQYVLVKDTAWCAMHTANVYGIHIEMSGESSQSRAEWLDAFGLAMLDQTAALIVKIAKDKNIPLKLLTDAELKARKPGITWHGQVTRVIGEGNTHTDPGPNFPFDELMARVNKLAGGTPPPRPAPVPTPRPPTAPKWPGRLLKYTPGKPLLRGDDVRTWQGKMRARGWRIDVDGVYGPQSADVCRRFQAEKHIGVDGIVGPETWRTTWTAPVTP